MGLVIAREGGHNTPPPSRVLWGKSSHSTQFLAQPARKLPPFLVSSPQLDGSHPLATTGSRSLDVSAGARHAACYYRWAFLQQQ